MIKTENLTPYIYYKESRDFQLFGRIYDFIFNYIKTNVDLIENFPINNHTDSKVIELLAKTLGFENKTNYLVEDLNLICNIFIDLMRNKGSISSVDKLARAILNLENIKEVPTIKIEDIESNKGFIKNIIIYMPQMSSNPKLKLFEEVLDYIIPAGVIYSIRDAQELNIDNRGYMYVSDNYAVYSIDKNNLINNNKIFNNLEDKIVITEQTKTKDIPLSIAKGDIRYSVIEGSNNKESK